MTAARISAIIMLLILALAASSAIAQTGGRIGNLNDPVQSVPDLLFGDQKFAYLVFPDQQVNCPGGGCVLQNVNMYLDFSDQQVPQTITVSGGFITAVPNPDGEGFIPGDDLCVAPPIQITILEPGLQLITIPVADVCDSVPVDEAYFLNINYVGDAVASLAIDNEPEAGIVYWDNGQGYTDMIDVIVDKTSDGKVIIWGDIICSIMVGVESRTWQDVKGLFR